MLFYFIMRTCANGMPRYNSNGDFNTSFHITRNGMLPDMSRKILNRWSVLLRKYNVEFRNVSYDEIKPGKNDFVYLDPPYAQTNGMYYGAIDRNKLFGWMKGLECDYGISYDGFVNEGDVINAVPVELYTSRYLLKSGNSSFRRVVSCVPDAEVTESFYLRTMPR